MSTKFLRVAYVLVVVSLLVSACTTPATPATKAPSAPATAAPTTAAPAPAGGPIKVGLITKTETNPFFVKMKEGAQAKADELGATLLTAAGKFDGDNESQVTAIENMVNAGVKGILITPSDTKAIVPTVKKARDAGVMVIALDTPTDPLEATDALFATDNFKAGLLIGQYAKAAMAGKTPKIATLDLLPGITVGILRHNGFMAGYGLAKADATTKDQVNSAEVVCSQDTQGDQAKGQTAMENCLQKNPDINLVYTINEPAAAGAYTALKAAGKEKDVMIVSVDGGCAPGLVGVQAGWLAATSQQYPLKMASMGVEAVVKFAKTGEKVSGYTDTGVTLITDKPVAGVDSKDTKFGLDACWGTKPAATAPSGEKVKIGLITKTETNPFFVKMKEGAQQKADELGMTLLTAAGKFDGDNESQVTAIENMVNAGVKGILITPSDTKAIVPTVKKARDAGVMVIALDTPTDPLEATDALFATDNFKAGLLIGQYAKAAMAGKTPKIATLDLLPGITVGILRHNGFMAGYGLAKADATTKDQVNSAEVVCSQDTQGDQAKGQTAMENCLQKNPDINLVYTINEPAAAGAYTALKAAGKEKDVMIVSVDGGCAPGLVGVQAGWLAATSQQYPLKMASMGVEAVNKFATTGEKASGYTDTGVTLITDKPVAGVDSKDTKFGLDACWGTKPAATAPSGEKVKIGLITKTETNPFFVKMKEGAQAKADELGMTLLTAAGKFDGDNESQVTAIENMVNAGVKGILITPSDTKAIVPTIKKARDAGVMVIALDTPTEPLEATDALFATDNFKAGLLIGQYAKAAMAGKTPKIATLDLLPGITVGILRHNGFMAGYGLAKADATTKDQVNSAEVVCSQDTQGDQAKGQTAMENCLQKNPDINLVYTINEPAAAGAYTALKAAGKEKDVMIVSVDGGCAPGLVGVQAGWLAATSQQYPLKMASMGVEAVNKFATTGEKASGYTDTGVTLITDKPVAGVDSKDTKFGLDACWGTK